VHAGVRSAVVHSKRSVDEVKLDVSRFRKGGLDVLWNCEKLTEVRGNSICRPRHFIWRENTRHGTTSAFLKQF
jgi:hypothetical protein